MRKSNLYNATVVILFLLFFAFALLSAGGCQSAASKFTAGQTATGNIAASANDAGIEIEAARPGVTPAGAVHLNNAASDVVSIKTNIPPVLASIQEGVKWKADSDRQHASWWSDRQKGAFWTTVTIIVILAVLLIFACVFLPMFGPVSAEAGGVVFHTLTAGIVKIFSKFDAWLANRIHAAQVTAAVAVNSSPVVAAAKADAAAALTSVGILAPATTPITAGPLEAGTQQILVTK